jgi:hypothetical protein
MARLNMQQDFMDTWTAIVEESEAISGQLEGGVPVAVIGGELMPDLPGKDLVPGILRLIKNFGGKSCLLLLSNLPDERIRAIRLASRLGVGAFILVEPVAPLPGHAPSDELAILTDQANFSGFNPLVGPNDERFGPRFPDMSRPFDEVLIRAVCDKATRRGYTLRKLVLAGLPRNQHEDLSLAKHLLLAGAGCLHHRIAQEVIVARHVGLKTLVLVSESDNQANNSTLHALALHAVGALD